MILLIFSLNRHHFYIPEMKTTKPKVFKNMAFVSDFLFFPTTSLPFFCISSFTVKKMAEFCQKLLLQKHARSHLWMICKDDYSQQYSLKSRPTSFPFLHLNLVNRAQLWNFTTLWEGREFDKKLTFITYLMDTF